MVRLRPFTTSFLLALLFATAAYAASSTLSGLSSGAAISDTDLFYDVQTSGTGGVKVTGLQLRTYMANYFGPGTVTSIATGCQATGGTITTSGTISTQNQWFPLSGNAILSTMCGGTVDVSGSSDTAPTIAEAGTSGFPAWWSINACSNGTSKQTLTAGGGTINFSGGGGTTYVLGAGTASGPSCVTLTSDGVSDYKVSFPPGATIATRSVSGTTDTYSNGDCGTLVIYTSGSAVTATIPATLPLGCNIAMLQAGAGKVSVNGSAVTPATLQTFGGTATGSAGQWATIGITIESNVGGSSAVAVLQGNVS